MLPFEEAFILCREEGIRTLDMLPYTRFPSVRLQPLGHLSIYFRLQRTRKKMSLESKKSILSRKN
jgi:hypothetical protein